MLKIWTELKDDKIVRYYNLPTP